MKTRCNQSEKVNSGNGSVTVEDLAKFPSENPNPVLRISRNGSLLYANLASKKLLTEWDLQEQKPVPRELQKAVVSSLSKKKLIEIEATHKKRVFSLSIAPVAESGYVNIYGLDITERVLSKEELKQALTDRETLIRELYHRTKNNMNLIVSMIALSASNSKDQNVQRLAQELENKIAAMALVHKKLYESKNLSSIKFDGYIEDLIELLKHSYENENLILGIELSLTPITLPIEIAIPLGLVINELFTNSLKHAFPDRDRGVIGITLKTAKKKKTAEIIYYDDGIGVPPDFDYRNQPTLGIQTIIMIVEHQLRGSLNFIRGPGFQCGVQFRKSVDEFYPKI